MSHRRGPTRLKHWHSIPASVDRLSATGTTLLGALAFVGSPTTILRAIGEYAIAPTSAGVALDACTITLVMGVVSTDAATVGASALPDPNAEPEYPWLWWSSHTFHESTTDPASAEATAGGRWSFDNRAMRILRAGQTLVFVAEYADQGGVPPYTIAAGATRILVAD